MIMKASVRIWCVVLGISLTLTNVAAALTYPFTEDFTAGTANWKNNAQQDLAQVAAGGPGDSSYVTTDYSFTSATNPQVAIFRGHNGFDSSGDAFVGDWLAANVGRLTAYVRHDAPQPLDFFVRVATSNNSPAVSFTLPQLIPAGSWNLLDFEIGFDNPLHTNEGPPTLAFYNNVLSNVGNVQLGVIVPMSLAENPTAFRYDLDRVSLVPEPSSGVIALGVVGLGLVSRRRQGR